MLTLPPKAQGFADLSKKTGTMMIYHRFMCGSGHFHLLKLISCLQYLGFPGFSQTTLCTACHDINSCMDDAGNDCPTAIAQRAARLRGRGPASQLHQRGFRTERHPNRDQPSDPAA